MLRFLFSMLLAAVVSVHADVGERYQDYIKRHKATLESLPRDEGGLWRVRHVEGKMNVLVTVFDGVICEERHYPVNRAEADALVLRQGNGDLKLLIQGLDEVRWTTDDKRLAARFSAKGRYLQISNPRQVEERLNEYRKRAKLE